MSWSFSVDNVSASEAGAKFKEAAQQRLSDTWDASVESQIDIASNAVQILANAVGHENVSITASGHVKFGVERGQVAISVYGIRQGE